MALCFVERFSALNETFSLAQVQVESLARKPQNLRLRMSKEACMCVLCMFRDRHTFHVSPGLSAQKSTLNVHIHEAAAQSVLSPVS